MKSQDVRRGITNHEINEQGAAFIGLEVLVFSCMTAWEGINWFGWNGFATFIISFVIMISISFTRLYHYIGFIFSIGWGILGFKIFQWITSFTGGGHTISIVIGVIGFILAVAITMGARLSGKEHFDDIGK